MKRLIILGFMATSMSGCALNSKLLPEEDKLALPETYTVKNIIKNTLSDEEKQQRVKNWWGQFNSEELLQIVEEAQKNSPTIGAAAVNIKNYENILLSNKSKVSPNLSLVSSSSSDYTNSGLSKNMSVGLTTSWEIDVFGKNALTVDLNKKQIENAKAMWHDAQTVVAAEAARSYFSYHFCKKTLSILKEDYEARKKQNEITNLKVQAGFEAEISFYQNEAGLSQSQSNILAQEAQCETEVKSLVALTAIPENKLKVLLSKEMKNIESLNLYVPVSIPGELLNQRPDVLNAVNTVRIAALDIAKARADNLPSISISGSISSSLTNALGVSATENALSIGPLNIHLPIFDMGVRKANEELLIKKYEQSKLELATSIRNAVKEIEISMINLSSRDQRSVLINKSVDNYKKGYETTMNTYKAGLSSLFNLEDSRRDYLSEVNSQLNNQLGKLNAWIDLYKAVGGGFTKIEVKDE
jgi:NodT family efflux transporter outer membrane factor (OMF) lipoprotein